jgi:large subunit ribosomal protein L17
MRHGKAGVKLGRTTSHRKAMFRNMVTSLFKSKDEKIQTTDAKAKELKRVAEKMITLAKRGDLHARRQALSYIRDKEVVGKLFSELSERYRSRLGGYTRIVKIGNRVGDNAPVSLVECIKEAGAEKPKRKAASGKS